MSGGGVELFGDWDEAVISLRNLSDPTKIARVIDDVVAAEAKFAAAEIKSGIRSQSPGGKPFKPLAPNTIASRRDAGVTGSKRLIATGATLKAITVKKIQSGKYWAGVPSVVVDGRNLADVFEVQENGATITQTVTKKMRGFLGARFGRAPSVGSTIVIRIPPSPTLQPIFDAVFKGQRATRRIQGRTTKRVNQLLKS